MNNNFEKNYNTLDISNFKYLFKLKYHIFGNFQNKNFENSIISSIFYSQIMNIFIYRCKCKTYSFQKNHGFTFAIS